jgi:hypothetical protein
MKNRGLELLAALSHGSAAPPRDGADPRASLLAERLVASGAQRPVIADVLTTYLERLAERPRERPRGWAYATMGAAGLAAILASHAIMSMMKVLELPGTRGLAVVPLGALILVVVGLVLVRRVERDEAEARALVALEALTKLGVSGPLAVEGARFLAGLDDETDPIAADELRTPSDLPDRARAVILSHRTVSGAADRRVARWIVPALAAAWTVLSFWILYFHVLAQFALGRGLGG